jgi:hypothetical protein
MYDSSIDIELREIHNNTSKDSPGIVLKTSTQSIKYSKNYNRIIYYQLSSIHIQAVRLELKTQPFIPPQVCLKRREALLLR